MENVGGGAAASHSHHGSRCRGHCWPRCHQICPVVAAVVPPPWLHPPAPEDRPGCDARHDVRQFLRGAFDRPQLRQSGALPSPTHPCHCIPGTTRRNGTGNDQFTQPEATAAEDLHAWESNRLPGCGVIWQVEVANAVNPGWPPPQPGYPPHIVVGWHTTPRAGWRGSSHPAPASPTPGRAPSPAPPATPVLPPPAPRPLHTSATNPPPNYRMPIHIYT